MPYLRQRARVPATGRIAVKLAPDQRDLFIASGRLPKALGHLLHRAPVRQGKLVVQLTRAELDAVIAAGVGVPARDPASDRRLDALLRYLESLADRFEEPADDTGE
jgi:hypothetical protein